MYSPRGFDIVRKKNGGRIDQSSILQPVANTGRNREITIGMFVVRAADGSVDGCRGVNDTTSAGAGARKIVGLVSRIHDAKGNVTDKQYLSTTDVGMVALYEDPAGLVYRGGEDGVGGSVDYTKTSIPQVDGAVINTTSELCVASPVPNDKLDSSAANATVGFHAFTLLGQDSNPLNFNNVAKVHEFTIAPGYVE